MGDRIRLVAAVVIMLTSAPVAFADTAQAKQHFDKATSAYALGRLAEAAQEYELAFDAKPDPALLYDAAQAHRLAGNKPRALLLYQNYLRIYGDKAPRHDEVNRRIAELKAAIETDQRVATAPPTEPAKPEPVAEPPAATPAPAPATVPAATATPTPVAHAALTERAPEKPLVKKPWFWAVIAGSAAVVATGVALGVVYGSSDKPPRASLGTLQAN